MPLNHEEAAVSIIVTGVSLGCVNPATKGWEAGFIRHPTHTLAVEVTRHAGGASTIFQPNREIPHDCTIRVATDDAAQTGATLFTRDDDAESFGLILDIEKHVYDGIKLARKRPEFGMTPLFVPSAVLYSVAGKLSDFPVRLIPKGDPSSTVRRFGRIGTAAGADIKREEGRETVVTVDGEGGFKIHLPHEAGVRYTVLFDNTCPPDTPDIDALSEKSDAGGEGHAAHGRAARPRGITKLSRSGEIVRPHSDFVLYYSILIPPSQRGFFDLVVDTSGRGDGAVCNYSHLGVTTSLFPVEE